MKNDRLYFQHDFYARNDGKLLKIRAKFGNEAGYGLFWMLCEVMAESDDGDLNGLAIDELSLMLGISEDRIKSFIDYAVEIRLFERNDDKITSRRMKMHKEWRISQSESGKKGAAARWKNGDPIAEPMATPLPTPKATAMHSTGQDRTVQTEQSSARARASQGSEKKTLLSDEQAEQQFFELSLSSGWSDQTYTDAKRKQFSELRGENREQVLRKMRVALNAAKSKSESTQKLARKIYFETVGLIQDRGLDQQTLDGKQIAKRREFAAEEGDIAEF